MLLTILLLIIAFYLLMGVIFVIPFLKKGITIVDEGARHATTGFKIIIIPGVITFWPVLLNKWIKENKKIVKKPAKE